MRSITSGSIWRKPTPPKSVHRSGRPLLHTHWHLRFHSDLLAHTTMDGCQPFFRTTRAQICHTLGIVDGEYSPPPGPLSNFARGGARSGSIVRYNLWTSPVNIQVYLYLIYIWLASMAPYRAHSWVVVLQYQKRGYMETMICIYMIL